MSHKKQSVLLIDDDNINIEILRPFLEKMDLRVETLSNGNNAVQNVSTLKPDLILLDIMMPDIDGYQVCKELKSNNDTQHIPIIFITAKTNTEDIVKGFNLGSADYICKPFKKQELKARVVTHLKLQKEIKRRKERELELRKTVEQLQNVIKENKILRELLPLCSKCKKVRDDEGYWKQIDEYFATHTDVQFSHSLCPGCAIELYPGLAQKIIDNLEAEKDK